jgi:SAM-dependent methyltransferase
MARKIKKPWPTKDVMNQIYDMHLWGGHTFDFYSGFGSHDSKIIKPYLKVLVAFLESHDKSLSVCDLGCGDFNVGKHLTKYTKKYIAVDIVKNLIDRNKIFYHEDNLTFDCLDITKDQLPKGDCVILRQVLQHLSNLEIQNIVKKIVNYKYVILTEHIPIGDFIPNKDIISGQGIRLKQNSGVNLLEPPFSIRIKVQKQLDEYILENEKGCIVTIMFELY